MLQFPVYIPSWGFLVAGVEMSRKGEESGAVLQVSRRYLDENHFILNVISNTSEKKRKIVRSPLC